MVTLPHGMQPLFIGIDGGGTKCRASIITGDRRVLGTGIGGPANPFHDTQRAKDSILAASELALFDAGLEPAAMNELIAGVGLAGVNVPRLYDVMSTWQHPFRQMHLTTDLHIACLGAHHGEEGSVMIVGTGSCGYSYVNNTAVAIGGHGFPIGDKGSGAWMGLEAIKAILLAADHLGPQTIMSGLIEGFLQARGLMVVDKLQGAAPSGYARFATFVMDAADAGDEVAIGIVKDGATYMSAMARKLRSIQPGRISIVGGLAARLLPWMDRDVVDILSPALYPPEFGAVYFARQCCEESNGHPLVTTLE